MNMIEIIELEDKYTSNTYDRFPVALIGGKGALLVSSDGKEYIDMGSGIAVNIFGVNDEVWKSAVTGQLGGIQHTCNLYYNRPCARLAQLLCERTGMKKVFFSNSGAEANECAIKTARRYGAQKLGADYYNIITLKNSFHGRTIATLAATGQDAFHTEFGPFPGGFLYADPAVPGDVTRLADQNKCCAVMIEVIQGEGGVVPLSPEFVEEVKAAAEKHGLLIIVDEVQTGNGRTGKLYGYMNYDIRPDIITTAKGLGGGLPIGATLFSERADVLTPGSHGSTFGGNPVCCAGAFSVIMRLDDAFLESVRAKSKYIIDELSGAEGVEGISGMGLMLGITTRRPVKDVINGCIENGVLPLSAKAKLRLLPPLCIEQEQLEKAVAVIKGELAK